MSLWREWPEPSRTMHQSNQILSLSDQEQIANMGKYLETDLSVCKVIWVSRNNHPQDISMSSKKLPSLPLRPWIITVVAYGIVFLSTGKLLIEAEDKGDIMEKQSWEIGKQRPDDDIQSLMPKLSSACAVTCSDLVSLSNAVLSLYFLNFSLFWFSCFKTKSIMLRIIIS